MEKNHRAIIVVLFSLLAVASIANAHYRVNPYAQDLTCSGHK